MWHFCIMILNNVTNEWLAYVHELKSNFYEDSTMDWFLVFLPDANQVGKEHYVCFSSTCNYTSGNLHIRCWVYMISPWSIKSSRIISICTFYLSYNEHFDLEIIFPNLIPHCWTFSFKIDFLSQHSFLNYQVQSQTSILN